MEDILKSVVIAVVCSVGVIVIRQVKPEMSVLLQLGGFLCIVTVTFGLLGSIIEYCEDMFSSGIIESSYLTLLIKALGIAVISKAGSDICKDSGNGALAFGVELAAKCGILILTLPMLKSLADAVSGLLKG